VVPSLPLRRHQWSTVPDVCRLG
jgi:hypothetical protein